MTSKEELPQCSSKEQKKSVKHEPKSAETSKHNKKHKYKSKRLICESGDESSSSELVRIQYSKDKYSPKHHSTSRASDKQKSTNKDSNNDLVQYSEHRHHSKKERRSSSDQSKSKLCSKKERRRARREHFSSDSSSSSSNSNMERRKSSRYKKHSSRHQSESRKFSPRKRQSNKKSRSLSESKKNLSNDPTNDFKFGLLQRRCGYMRIHQESKSTFQEDVKEPKTSTSNHCITQDKRNEKSQEDNQMNCLITHVGPVTFHVDADRRSSSIELPAPVVSTEFDKNTEKLDASTVLVIPATFHDKKPQSKASTSPRPPLDSLKLIEQGFSSIKHEPSCITERLESKLVVTQNMNDPKYLLVQPGTSRDHRANISYPRSAPTTHREIESTEMNFRPESDMTDSSELDLTASALLLAPYTSPRCSKTIRIENIITDNSNIGYRVIDSTTTDQINSTQFSRRFDMLDPHHLQSDFGIGSIDDFQSCRDLLNSSLYENIREFFADLPLPPVPGGSRQYDVAPEEDIRQRWKQEFGQQSEDDDGTDDEEEAEDLEIILDLCNDRFLKRRPQSRE